MTGLLQRASAGDGDARQSLYRLLYPELMGLARGHLARAGTISLDITAVTHEAYLRLAARDGVPDANRHVFLAYASKVMRSVIIDYIRQRGAQKRGGDEAHLTLSSVADSLFVEQPLEGIEAALASLERIDERAARVVEMRYYGGMREEEIAGVLGLSGATIRRDWRRARAFLYEQLR